MLNEMQQRLDNMKLYLAQEKADPEGSKMYISDLQGSIKQLEQQIQFLDDKQKFMMMCYRYYAT